MYADAIHSFWIYGRSTTTPRNYCTSVAKRIGRPQIRGIDERFCFLYTLTRERKGMP